MPNSLNISNDDINTLVKAFGTPLQIYDGSLIIENQKNFIETMNLKITEFVNYILTIVDDEQKELIQKEISVLRDDRLKCLLFIMTISEKSKNKNIDEFMKKYKIKEEFKERIEMFYTIFLELKCLLC